MLHQIQKFNLLKQPKLLLVIGCICFYCIDLYALSLPPSVMCLQDGTAKYKSRLVLKGGGTYFADRDDFDIDSDNKGYDTGNTDGQRCYKLYALLRPFDGPNANKVHRNPSDTSSELLSANPFELDKLNKLHTAKIDVKHSVDCPTDRFDAGFMEKVYTDAEDTQAIADLYASNDSTKTFRVRKGILGSYRTCK